MLSCATGKLFKMTIKGEFSGNEQMRPELCFKEEGLLCIN